MFTLNIDTKQMIAELDTIARNHMPFAMALGMNRTMEDVQSAQLQRVAATMTIRARRFIANLVKIAPDDRAKKDRLTASVRIEGPRDKPSRGKVLTRHEAGGVRTAASQAPMFIPTRALRGTAAQVISQALYPSYLGVVTSRVGDSGKLVEPTFTKVGPRGTRHVLGRRRTFVLRADLGHRISARAAGVYQRVGVGRGGIVRIWQYKPFTTLQPSLMFGATFARVVAERFNENLTNALATAIEDDRQGGRAKAWRAARPARGLPMPRTETL